MSDEALVRGAAQWASSLVAVATGTLTPVVVPSSVPEPARAG